MAHYGQNVRHFSVGGLLASSYDDEMAAYEALGPSVRRVLNDGPIKVASVPILQQIRDRGLDPQDPAVDGAVARGMVAKSAQIIMLDRTEQDARDGITPLRARRTRRW